jgi:hypothetical protein
MRPRLLIPVFTAVLVGVACAQGSSVVGLAGGGVPIGGSTTTITVSSSGSSSGSGGATTSSHTGSSSTTSSTSSGMCAESPCKLVSPQCGCMSGQACTFAPGATTRTCEKAGTTPAGQGCTGSGQCAAGTICLGGGAADICVQFCATDSDCAATGGICALQLSNGMGGAIPNEMLCSSTCDITTNVGCSVAGTACQIGIETTGQMRTFTYCTSAGTKGKNQACTATTDCLPKFDCINDNGSTICLEYCYVNSPVCPTCVALQNSTTMMPIFIGANQVGVCQ